MGKSNPDPRMLAWLLAMVADGRATIVRRDMKEKADRVTFNVTL